jgi:DNA-binding transcriptional LysR family regulator
MTPDLRELRYFVGVAEELSFTRAARRLHVSQPSLSVAMRQLEARLGVTLLDRTTRRVALTPAGGTLLAHARRVLEASSSLERAVAAHRAPERGGRLRVGLDRLASAGALATLREFAAAHPAVELEIAEADADALDQNRVDVLLTQAGAVLRAQESDPLALALAEAAAVPAPLAVTA